MLRPQNLAPRGTGRSLLNPFGKAGIARPAERTGGTSLVRGINKLDLAAVVFNSVIGASVFGLSATAYKLANSYSLLALLACTFLSG